MSYVNQNIQVSIVCQRKQNYYTEKRSKRERKNLIQVFTVILSDKSLEEEEGKKKKKVTFHWFKIAALLEIIKIIY